MTVTDYTTLFKQAMPNQSVENIRIFSLLLDALLEKNKVMNLTAVTDPVAAVYTHFVDSLALVDALSSMEEGIEVFRLAADIGSGAGFPALPCATVMLQCDWYPVESIAKKTRFTEEVAQKAGLQNVHPLAIRAEELARMSPAANAGYGRESFDLVTARALSSIPVLLEILLPLARVGGVVALFKTTNTQEELAQLNQLAPLLGGTVLEPYCYRLSGDRSERLILRIRKTVPTSDKYPRRNGVPFKKPLA